ncbi:MAG TPA: DNA starvation/stationary phase protection protein [Acidimicrobiia bacterium]|jgi:starvation-inducible DNA-binding protein
MSVGDAEKVVSELDTRLAVLIDLALTLKHIHWNVVGPQFISVHEMIDAHLDMVRPMVDSAAERIATLGGTPTGTAAHVVESRGSDDYPIAKAGVGEHLAALDVVYTEVITGHRNAAELVEDLDPVTQDLLIEHLRGLEQLQWFVRAHLENAAGAIAESTGEKAAANKVRKAADS